MKRFNPKAALREQDALEDKIEVQLGNWIMDAGDDETFKAFKHHLAGPPEDDPESIYPMESAPPVHGTFFCRPSNKGSDFFRLLIRSRSLKNNGEAIPAPLCSGHIQFTPLQKGGSLFKVHLSLFLNLARYVRHQVKNEETPPMNRKAVKARLAKRNAKRADFGNEVTLIKDDNWIPDDPVWRSFARSSSDEWHFRRYITELVKRVHKDLRRAALYAGIPTPKRAKLLEDYSLRLVETYWEFASDNPIEEVRLIEAQAKVLRSKDATSHYYKVTGSGRVQNSPSVTIRLRADCQLRIYAKTNRRVRFEVIQENLPDHRLKLLHSKATKNTSKLHSELIQFMTQIRKRAKKLLGDFCSDFASAYGEHPRPYTPLEFLLIVAQVMPSYSDIKIREDMFKQVITCLIENHGWENRKPDGIFGVVLSLLEKRGVILWHTSLKRYVVGDRFRAAVTSLQGMRSDTMKLLSGVIRPKLGRAIRER